MGKDVDLGFFLAVLIVAEAAKQALREITGATLYELDELNWQRINEESR